MGMWKFNERNVVNSIDIIKSGADAGKLKFAISTSPFTSKSIVVDVSNVHGMLSLGNDDMGEDDLECNLIQLSNFKDPSSGQMVEAEMVTLPADGWKDLNLLDWVLSIKTGGMDQSEAEFNDLMV